jgi:hypothetical protein
MKVRRGDTPHDCAPIAIEGTTYRGLDLIREVGECTKNTLSKGSHGFPAAGWRVGHRRVIPLDVMRQESREIIEISGVPRIHESLDHFF